MGDENLWKRSVKRQKSRCTFQTEITIGEKKDRNGGRGGRGMVQKLGMTLQATIIEGERWTHNGRRSRAIIDRGVHAAGHTPTDRPTD